MVRRSFDTGTKNGGGGDDNTAAADRQASRANWDDQLFVCSMER